MFNKEIALIKSREEFLWLFGILLLLFCFSLLIEFHNYKKLTQFDSAIINATVLKQYKKTKERRGKLKHYQVLKLKADDGFTFYTTASKKEKNLQEKELKMEIFFRDITFLSYLKSFFAFHKILEVKESSTLKQQLNNFLDTTHKEPQVADIYKALYSATPLKSEEQKIFSTLGVSHLLAISGFHLGVLSALLFFLLKKPYKFFQNRYFPYRNSKKDLFIVVSFILLLYLLFLDSPPSLLRSFSMLIVGFFLYDRGYKVISMQTLLLTIVTLLALSPRLFFELGFWLSVAGVFYIFLFLLHFKEMKNLSKFLILPVWIYLFMLPFSLAIFHNFSLYHPLSIVLSSLFTLFYPLSIFLHIVGFGDLLDGVLTTLLSFGEESQSVVLSMGWLYIYILFSLLSLFKESTLYALYLFNGVLFSYAIWTII